MAEELIIDMNASKKQKYEELLPQLTALCAGEPDTIANLANITAAVKEVFGHLWIGFYLVRGNELVLGPFQGPVACTRIQYGKGVCGKAWQQASTILVPDVDEFPGHIACSSMSRSEVVVPVIRHEEVVAVLDIDSDKLDAFDETDQHYLERLVSEETFKF